MKITWLILLFFAAQIADAAAIENRYFVTFSDKNNSAYSIQNPSAFLSPRAIARRNKFGIAVTEKDIPVNHHYLMVLDRLGATILCKSKWLNGATIEANESTVINIRNLPFVKDVQLVTNKDIPSAGISKFHPFDWRISGQSTAQSLRTASINYGLAYNQVHMINCDYLHDSGFDGSGMVIALLDAGFRGVDSLLAFDSIRTNNQILATWDFVHNETDVYAEPAAGNEHGMEVLSCIASNLPGTLVGTAPHASFYLLETEDVTSETLAEEFYWAAGAEYADSAGADIISSSLGYFTFDDPSQNHTYSDMNGHTTVAALAANHAASVGMLVVVAAGNEGNGAWNYILTPSDADSALAIGAVDANGAYAFFSGNGPASDGDVKPNVATQGDGAAIYFGGNFAGFGNGTSFAAPILAGAAACLWQAFDSLSNMQIYSAIQRSASQFTMPDTLLGYGIPNFMTAFTLLHTKSISMPAKEGIVNIYPVPIKDYTTLVFNSLSYTPARVILFDVLGHQVFAEDIHLVRGIQGVNLDLESVSKGVYFLNIFSGEKSFTKALVKQ